MTAGVMAGDIAATLMMASRIVAETSALYGYDPNDPAEQVFMTGVLGAATATSEGAKLAAQRELRELAKLLARRAPYRLLDKSVFTHVVRRAYAKLGDKMTHAVGTPPAPAPRTPVATVAAPVTVVAAPAAPPSAPEVTTYASRLRRGKTPSDAASSRSWMPSMRSIECPALRYLRMTSEVDTDAAAPAPIVRVAPSSAICSACLICSDVGAGMNAALMHRTADEAYYAYRERRLQDRYDLDSSDRDRDASEIIVDAEVVDDSEEPLDIIGLLDEAQRESGVVDKEASDEDPGRGATDGRSA